MTEMLQRGPRFGVVAPTSPDCWTASSPQAAFARGRAPPTTLPRRRLPYSRQPTETPAAAPRRPTGTEDAGDGPLSAETVRAAARACRRWADEQTPAPLRMWPSRDHRSRIKQPHPDVQRRTAKLSQPVRYALLFIRQDFRWSLRVMRIAVRVIWIVRPARSARSVSAAWV